MDKKLSVRRQQKELISSMLNPFKSNESIPDWKFIIYDSDGRDIIDSLYSIRDLRDFYVTLRLPITSQRDSIPDPISAIYFVMPTEENIKIICNDLKEHLYDSYYFNFLSSLSHGSLQLIAEIALEEKINHDIKIIKSQYLNFISVEDDFFILKESERDLVSYHAINRSDATDDEITNVIERIVDGLFSVLVTMNMIPIIRCPKGGPAEVIAKLLTRRLRDILNESDEASILFGQQKSRSTKFGRRRPLLCLIDRTVDMSTPLHHTWTYQALIHDLFNIKLNMTTILQESESKAQQSFDLNQEDKFWQEEKGSPFPQVADAVQRELDEFKKHKDDVNNLAMVGVERLLKKHTTLATAILDEIKARKLDNYFEIEEKIMNRSPIDKVLFDEMLMNPNSQPNDKYRLFLIAYICDNPILSEQEADKYVDKLVEEGSCQRSAYEYVKQWKTFSKSNVVNLQASLQSGGGGVLKTASMFTKLVSQSSQFVMEGVKNLVLKDYHLPITKIVDNLMDSSAKSNKWSMEYIYFDPQVDTNEIDLTKREKSFKDAIVFVVGGGNYIEYQNLVDYNKSKSISLYEHRNVIYGATDLMNANQFLEHLKQLGSIIEN